MYAGTTLATNVFMPWKICCTFSTQSVFNNSLQNALIFALIFDNADNVNVYFGPKLNCFIQRNYFYVTAHNYIKVLAQMRMVSLNSKTTVRAKVAKTEEMVFAIMQEVLFFFQRKSL